MRNHILKQKQKHATLEKTLDLPVAEAYDHRSESVTR